MNIRRTAFAIAASLALIAPAAAQSPANVATPWWPLGRLSSNITASSSSAATALPSTGNNAWVCNTGSNDAFLTFGGSGAVAVLGAGSWLKAGTCGYYSLNPVTNTQSRNGYIAAITASSTTTLRVETGAGSPPAGIASSGGGGGGSVTQGTDPWLVAGKGTAGTPDAAPVTVQGITGMTPVQVSQATAANLNATIVGTGTLAVQASQAGTWTVQPGNTPNATPWLVTAASATAPIMSMNSASANGGINSALAGVFDDASPTAITENNFGFLRMSTNRNLYGTIRDAGGNERGLNIDANNRLSAVVVGLTARASPAASPPVLMGGTADGTATGNVGNWKVDSAGSGFIDMVAGGNLATALASGAGTPGSTAPTANVAIGGKGVNAEQTAVTNGQNQNLITDLVGKLITLPYANPENFVSGTITSSMTGTTSTSLVASPGGSLRNYITACTFSNAHATVGTDIILQDGNGGTTLWTVPAAAVYGGAHITFPTPLRQPTAATALYAQNVTTGASTKASCNGYKGL